jgi:hypothetical protein
MSRASGVRVCCITRLCRHLFGAGRKKMEVIVKSEAGVCIVTGKRSPNQLTHGAVVDHITGVQKQPVTAACIDMGSLF